MSSIHTGLTLPKAINNSEELYQKLVRSAARNDSRSNQPTKRHTSSNLLRAQLIHLANVRTRTLLTTRDVKTREDLIQGARNTMEEKSQQRQGSVKQTLSKISDKLTSLFSKRNFVAQGTDKLESSITTSNPVLANENIYPITGNIAASTETNTAISLQAGETPAEAAINIISLHAPELSRELPIALNQSVTTLNKVSEKIAKRALNASLL